MILRDADPADVAAILAEVNFKHGALHTVMAEARKRTGLNLGELTVLSPQNDPYRLDTPPNRADAKWFADQFERFVSHGDTIHLRGFHYVMLSHGGVYLPDGRPYINDSWLWMSDEASTSARMLGYVPFERINDERNAPPEVFPAEDWEVEVCLDEGGLIFLPGKKNVVPKFKCHLPTRQTYRIVLIGEKSSLKPILRPIAERIHAELLLPNGEASTTMIAGMARRAAEDGRPLIVLYFSDFDPSGWQMPITVSRKLQACRVDVLKETEPPEIPDLPDSELPEEPDDPLYTTDDDYETATLKLKARKGYLV